MKLIDPAHPFYRPLAVRLVLVGVTVIWTLVEAVFGDPMFMVLVGGLAAYCIWMLFIKYKPPADPAPEAAAVETETKPSDETSSAP